jgi:hypothetical protein
MATWTPQFPACTAKPGNSTHVFIRLCSQRSVRDTSAIMPRPLGSFRKTLPVNGGNMTMSSITKHAILALALILLLAQLVLVPSAQAASVWYVAPGGNDANSCLSPTATCASINVAIAKAAAGDEIRVAIGTFTNTGYEVVQISKSCRLSVCKLAIPRLTVNLLAAALRYPLGFKSRSNGSRCRVDTNGTVAASGAVAMSS